MRSANTARSPITASRRNRSSITAEHSGWWLVVGGWRQPTTNHQSLTTDYIMNLYDRIPNNVNLADDQRLQRALEKWLPNYLDWWREMGPAGFQEKDVYLRTAISVEPDGW